MDVRARWRPSMWQVAGLRVLDMDDLRPNELAVVEEASRLFERAQSEG